MKGLSFPLFKTKIAGVSQSFRLEDPVERRKYFDLKCGVAVEKIREYLRTGTFVGFLLGKKNSGKGTYTRLFMEALGGDRVAHISVGDIVRSVHTDLADAYKKKELIEFLKKQYRGFISIEKALDVILGRDTKTLLPTEIILALVEREISRIGRKAIFIDGFPRNLDQISYSLFFRTLMGYRDDPDFFVFIDVPEAVVDERMRGRVICPTCHTPRHPKLLRTQEIGYDTATKTFFLKCDNSSCNSARMVGKEGDELGIEAIRERIELDDTIMRRLLELEGVPKVLLRNAVPIAQAPDSVDEYEITPSYSYEWDEASGTVRVHESPWIFDDDNGEPSHSLLPSAVVVSFLNQTPHALGLE